MSNLITEDDLCTAIEKVASYANCPEKVAWLQDIVKLPPATNRLAERVIRHNLKHGVMNLYDKIYDEPATDKPVEIESAVPQNSEDASKDFENKVAAFNQKYKR